PCSYFLSAIFYSPLQFISHFSFYFHSLSLFPSPFFFFTATATTAIYPLSLHDALPIFPNPGRQLKAGMVATVEVAAPAGPEIPAGQPTVSLGAIVKSARTGGGYAVFVAEGPDERTVARARDVSLGGISGNRVAVATGIRAGEKVIVSGASLLADGDPVRLIPGS